MNNRLSEKVEMIPIIYKILSKNIKIKKENFESFKYGENNLLNEENLSMKSRLMENDIIVMGFSAGGELAVNLIFNKEKQEEFNIDKSVFKGLITLSGVLDFEKCTSKHSINLIKNYIGQDFSIHDTNPIRMLDKWYLDKTYDIPILSLHGGKDPLINLENSISFINKINFLGGNSKLKILKDRYHSDVISLIISKREKESRIILDFIEDIWKG